MHKPRHYDIQTPRNKYRCKVLPYGRYDKIYFGGEKRCMVLTIHHQDRLAHIDAAGYHNYCNTTGDFKKGAPGTIDMINACLSFLRMKYPKLQRVTLIDDSRIECDKKVPIPLSFHYIIKYKKTWYEKHFGATLEDPSEHAKYQSFIATLTTTPKPFDFGYFDKHFLKPSRMKPSQYKAITTELEPIFAASSSLSSFLQKINDAYDCAVFDRWLDTFVTEYSKISFRKAYWSIDHLSSHKSPPIRVQRSAKTYDWSQFGGIPSHIKLRENIPL